MSFIIFFVCRPVQISSACILFVMYKCQWLLFCVMQNTMIMNMHEGDKRVQNRKYSETDYFLRQILAWVNQEMFNQELYPLIGR